MTDFSAAFPDADEASWRGLVEKALKGKGPESLERRTLDGRTMKPLYRETDYAASTDPDGVPGTAPFVRGTSEQPDPYLPWDIRQVIAHPVPATAHEELMHDLERGVSSIELRLDVEGQNGVAIQTLDDLKATLEGVMTDLAPLALSNSALQGFGLEGATLVAAWSAAEGRDASKELFAFNIDPLGELMRSGGLSKTTSESIKEAAAFAKDASTHFPSATSLRVDARPIHEAGGGDAMELATMLASGVAYLKALMDEGLSLEKANAALLVTLSVGPNYMQEIAKLRAARRLWSRMTEAFGAEGGLPMQLQVVTSRRMLTQRDPWVNMLRNTAACFAGGVGGANVVTVRPFTDALGLAGKLARRTARNTQIIAQEESSLGKVADPAGGTWSVGAMAEDLAQAAWTLFQEIESQGGLGAALEAGTVQTNVAKTRNDARKAIAKRKMPITGVSEYALLDEMAADVVDVSSLQPPSTLETGSSPAARTFDAMRKAAQTGASITTLQETDTEEGAEIDPLFPIRWAEPFEQLRDHADAYKARTGNHPQIFLATLGAVADHTARATFTANLFAAGGIQAVNEGAPFESDEAIVAAFKGSGAVLACICGSDAQYEEHGARVAIALREGRSDARIYMAGKPGDAEAALRDAGVDDFIHMGVDVIQKLEIAHAELGLSK